MVLFFGKNSVVNISLLFCVLFVSSCWGTRDYDKKYLYDQVGFKGQNRPVRSNYESNRDSQKTNKINSIAPQGSYYYDYGTPSQPQAPAPRRAINTFNGGGSRFYSNPYAIPAAQVPQGYYSNSYPGYRVYDADRFYVPPNSYRYIEKDNNRSSLDNSR